MIKEKPAALPISLEYSSTGPRDVGLKDTHHVESISKLIWNLLENGICQPLNSLEATEAGYHQI